MDISNIVATLLILILAGFAIYIRIRRNGKTFNNFDEFLSEYGDNIISALRDAINILKIDMSNYDNTEEYEKDIISYAVKAIYNNPSNYGIPEELTVVIDEDTMINMVQKIFIGKKPEAFKDLSTVDIMDNERIIDPRVIIDRNLNIEKKL